MNNKEKLKRLLFLSEYKNSSNDKKLITENIDAILESKQTEQQAVAVLKRNNPAIEDAVHQITIDKLKPLDRTQNQVLLPALANASIQHQNINDLRALFNTVGEFVTTNKISPPQIDRDGNYVIKDKVFRDYLKFSEYIHGLESMGKGLQQWKGEINVETNEKPLFDQNGIKIYDGNDVGKCIKYTTGGLTGQHYGFCIGQPANTMWQSYRDTKTSTFHYVVDENRDLSDPLHIVVVDATQHGIELTDANNSTNNIAEYGNDTNAYLKYLGSKGVPVEQIFKNKLKTPEEEAETAKLGSRNTDLQWLKDLSFQEKSKYIGRGHLLNDEQFNYLWNFKNDKGGFHLLKQYVSTGQAIPEEQFNILIGKDETMAAAAE